MLGSIDPILEPQNETKTLVYINIVMIDQCIKYNNNSSSSVASICESLFGGFWWGAHETARMLWDYVGRGFSFGVVDRGGAGKIGRQVGGGSWPCSSNVPSSSFMTAVVFSHLLEILVPIFLVIAFESG
jgi:hypothetical protein